MVAELAFYETLPQNDLGDDSVLGKPGMRLWRYMDFAKFASLMLNENIFFSQASKMEDRYEAVGSKKLREYLRDNYDFYSPGAPPGAWIDRLSRVRDCVYINCWHANEGESAAMWTLYGIKGQSIAISTSYESFMRALPEHVFVGQVRYIDHNNDAREYNRMEMDIQHFLLAKQMSYAHEREVRAFFSTDDVFWMDRPQEEVALNLAGHQVPVDLSRLVEEIFVDPRASRWFVELVNLLAKRVGLDGRVRPSTLLDDPTYLAAERAVDLSD